MTGAPTDDERIQCLAETAVVTSKSAHGTTVRTAVREHPAWTAADGEELPSEWVVEIRFGKPFRVAILELEAWRALRSTPGAWQDLVLREVS